MTPALQTTILRLDPAHQPLWRDGTILQFGLDRRAEIEVTAPWQDALLNRLAHGIRSERFDIVAHSLGAPRGGARKLLSSIRPVLHPARVIPPRVHMSSSEHLPATVPLWMREALRTEGLVLSEAEDRGSVALVAVRGAASARAFSSLLSEDRAHLPISFDIGGACIGPLVVPGRTPCLHCRDAAATDLDPAWPLLHSQMVEADAGVIAASRVVEAASVAAALLSVPPLGGLWLRINRDGERSRHSVRFHEECQCQMLRSRRESARPSVPRAPSAGATRPPASAPRG